MTQLPNPSLGAGVTSVNPPAAAANPMPQQPMPAQAMSGPGGAGGAATVAGVQGAAPQGLPPEDPMGGDPAAQGGAQPPAPDLGGGGQPGMSWSPGSNGQPIYPPFEGPVNMGVPKLAHGLLRASGGAPGFPAAATEHTPCQAGHGGLLSWKAAYDAMGAIALERAAEKTREPGSTGLEQAELDDNAPQPQAANFGESLGPPRTDKIAGKDSGLLGLSIPASVKMALEGIGNKLQRSAVGESGLVAAQKPWSLQGEDAWPTADMYHGGKRKSPQLSKSAAVDYDKRLRQLEARHGQSIDEILKRAVAERYPSLDVEACAPIINLLHRDDEKVRFVESVMAKSASGTDKESVAVPHIGRCARCHGDHDDMVFHKLAHPTEEGGFTHVAKCPTNGQPILMKQSDDDHEEVHEKDAFIIPSMGGKTVNVAPKGKGIGATAGYDYLGGVVPIPSVGIDIGGPHKGLMLSGPLPGIGYRSGFMTRPGGVSTSDSPTRSLWKWLGDKRTDDERADASLKQRGANSVRYTDAELHELLAQRAGGAFDAFDPESQEEIRKIITEFRGGKPVEPADEPAEPAAKKEASDDHEEVHDMARLAEKAKMTSRHLDDAVAEEFEEEKQAINFSPKGLLTAKKYVAPVTKAIGMAGRGARSGISAGKGLLSTGAKAKAPAMRATNAAKGTGSATATATKVRPSVVRSTAGQRPPVRTPTPKAQPAAAGGGGGKPPVGKATAAPAPQGPKPPGGAGAAAPSLASRAGQAVGNAGRKAKDLAQKVPGAVKAPFQAADRALSSNPITRDWVRNPAVGGAIGAGTGYIGDEAMNAMGMEDQNLAGKLGLLGMGARTPWGKVLAKVPGLGGAAKQLTRAQRLGAAPFTAQGGGKLMGQAGGPGLLAKTRGAVGKMQGLETKALPAAMAWQARGGRENANLQHAGEQSDIVTDAAQQAVLASGDPAAGEAIMQTEIAKATAQGDHTTAAALKLSGAMGAKGAETMDQLGASQLSKGFESAGFPPIDPGPDGVLTHSDVGKYMHEQGKKYEDMLGTDPKAAAAAMQKASTFMGEMDKKYGKMMQNADPKAYAKFQQVSEALATGDFSDFATAMGDTGQTTAAASGNPEAPGSAGGGILSMLMESFGLGENPIASWLSQFNGTQQGFMAGALGLFVLGAVGAMSGSSGLGMGGLLGGAAAMGLGMYGKDLPYGLGETFGGEAAPAAKPEGLKDAVWSTLGAEDQVRVEKQWEKQLGGLDPKSDEYRTESAKFHAGLAKYLTQTAGKVDESAPAKDEGERSTGEKGTQPVPLPRASAPPGPTPAAMPKVTTPAGPQPVAMPKISHSVDSVPWMSPRLRRQLVA